MALEWAIVVGIILFVAGMVVGALILDNANSDTSKPKKTSLLDLHKGHH